MMKIFTWISITYFLLALNTQYVDGCSCFPTHPQQKFCNSDFVIVGKVESETLIPGPPDDTANNLATYVYRIELLSSLKGIRRRPGSTIEVQTPGNGALCGVRLPVGKAFLFGGRREDRQTSPGPQGRVRRRNNKVNVVRSCDLFIDEKNMTFEQMLYFFTRGSYSYRRNCGCKISESGNGCTIPSGGPPSSPFCYFSHGLCRKTRNSCSWVNIDECLPK